MIRSGVKRCVWMIWRHTVLCTTCNGTNDLGQSMQVSVLNYAVDYLFVNDSVKKRKSIFVRRTKLLPSSNAGRLLKPL